MAERDVEKKSRRAGDGASRHSMPTVHLLTSFE
jgi:hypothetical protein